MKTVLISKDKLLNKMAANRNGHHADFVEAHCGWQEKVIEELEKALKNAKEDIEFITNFNIPEPIDHTDEYDQIIDQIKWNEEEQIKLDYRDFNRFVLDNWDWKDEFIGTNAFYSKFK